MDWRKFGTKKEESKGIDNKRLKEVMKDKWKKGRDNVR